MPHPELLFFFLTIAFIYASVGFGGGSSYLAILALYAVPRYEMKLTALVCNIIVVTGGTFLFIRRRELQFSKVLPIAIASVPMSFIGARLHVSQATFFVLLGTCLIMAGIFLWLQPSKTDVPLKDHDTKPNYLRDALLGGSIGLLSGMVSIGGGIFLAPVLNLLHWDTPKKIAATASFFILINSIAGLAGQLSSLQTSVDTTRIALLAIAVLAGGQLGSRLGIAKLSPALIRRLTAVLVFAAGIEVLYKQLAT
ncbi:sulfite exporter TauE/SafE family protein [Nemorincola caseinilytica]|uniref:Probable membrane transporter protein n=1 Tax=Nemorincola caseinilytica TaxID=2054315 RepID=A0ABP8NHV2_9BACT